MKTYWEGIVRCQRCGLYRQASQIPVRQCHHCALLDRRRYMRRA